MNAQTNKPARQICCIGEILWDAMPQGLFLGGAPLNVCSHLAMLGERTVMVSRVGDDRLGREALRRIEGIGIPVGHIQQDDRHETGFVEVDLIQKEGPGYTIIEPVAWDFITLDESVEKAAEQSDVVVFGTLAQRNRVSRQTIRHFCEGDDLKIYDVNLRPPFDDREIIEASLRAADIIKMNEEELMEIAGWWNYPRPLKSAIEALADAFACSQVCITKGKEGALLYNEGSWTEQKGIEVEVVNTVGAGDAFLAAFISGLNRFETDRERLIFANTLGAFIATKQSGCPDYSMEDIAAFATTKGVGAGITE